MSKQHTHNLLQGLLTGESPLPPPHPQTLNFPNDRRTTEKLAGLVYLSLSSSQIVLTDDELRHLLYKMADWARRTGCARSTVLPGQFAAVWVAVELTMRRRPEWLLSRAGVSYAQRYLEGWKRLREKQARAAYTEPPRVAEVDFQQGWHLVELTTGAHVYAEGKALEHCMATSMNIEALRKLPNPDDVVSALECLTYAVKIRSGRLRVFSLRDETTCSIATIAYAPRAKSVPNMQYGRKDNRFSWGLETCSAVRALSTIVKLDRMVGRSAGCLRACPGNGWCEKSLQLFTWPRECGDLDM